VDAIIATIEERLQDGLFDEAAALADTALRKHKAPARLILLGAAAHDAIGNRQRRTAVLTRGRRLHPEDWTIALASATYAGYDSDWKTADSLYHAAWSLLPDHERRLRADCCMRSGMACYELGDTEHAMAAFIQALREDPTHPGVTGLITDTIMDIEESRAASPRVLRLPHSRPSVKDEGR
jgi:tetratricopeptide (TPR) repeat protein